MWASFLRFVHALALCSSRVGLCPYIPTVARLQAWVRNRHAKTSLAKTPRNAKLHQLIARAEAWLNNNTYPNRIIKWKTEEWG